MADFTAQLDGIMPTALAGSVAETVGTTISAAGFPAPRSSFCPLLSGR